MSHFKSIYYNLGNLGAAACDREITADKSAASKCPCARSDCPRNASHRLERVMDVFVLFVASLSRSARAHGCFITVCFCSCFNMRGCVKVRVEDIIDVANEVC